MKVAGLVAEFNPLHNGHEYLINHIKSENGALVCVMSGNFVQRGSVALFDKWTRTRAALSCGVDLVIELPTQFALSSAQDFAYGSVYLLDSLGIVDSLYFGSESGNIDELIKAASLIYHEPEEISLILQNHLKSGQSYPTARAKAFEGLIPQNILDNPNNILALEYICSLLKLNSTISPLTIQRHISDYHEQTPTCSITSATALRNLYASKQDILPYTPNSVHDLFVNATPRNTEHLVRILKSIVLTKGCDYINTIQDVSEGLENRIYSACCTKPTIDEISDEIKTKRYTRTRIDRILMRIVLGLDKSFSNINPQYVRVLGMNTTGMKLLSMIKQSCTLPIITKTSNYKKKSKLFQKDILATDISELCIDDLSNHKTSRDFTTSPVIDA